VACEWLKSGENKCNEIVKAWIVKLAKMAQLQQLFAERAINGILFEGHLGT
jgi:hypothetical protein